MKSRKFFRTGDGSFHFPGAHVTRSDAEWKYLSPVPIVKTNLRNKASVSFYYLLITLSEISTNTLGIMNSDRTV